MIHFALALVLQRWLVVNDIHLDAFSRRGIVYGTDTTPALWRSALRAMRADVPDPRVVVLGGDMLTHEFAQRARAAGDDPEASALSSMQTLAGDLDRAFPRTQFLFALGNNDDFCGDYRSEVRGAYQARLARIWAPLVDRGGAAPAFIPEFSGGGYYTARLPIQRGEAIVLNSVFWSIVYSGGCASEPHDPGAMELSWLENRLARLPPDANAMLLLHIPPGYDPQSTATTVHRLIAVPFLKPHDNTEVLKMIADHRRQLRVILAAHTHRYDFRVAGDVPTLIASSLSPVYHNNPAFYVLDVDAAGEVHDIHPFAYNPDTGAWDREPSFDAMYGAHAFTASALLVIAARLQSDAQLRAVWRAAYNAWSAYPSGVGADWRPYACAQTQLDGGYAACAGTARRSRAAVVVALLALALAVLLVWATMNRR
ncbi:MAG TPA: metallophosphoesterase [Verrucomicrobiae bacterium]|nr:metallophosphoesterase [Verrucomicrobiae bacterium]